MKLSSGLGLPSVAQSFNAKGVMGPYIWAHNAVGETITLGGDNPLKNPSNITLGNVSTGVSLNQGSSDAVFRFWEANSSKTSGLLNEVDTNRGRYLYIVISFTGPGTAQGTVKKNNHLWWYAGSGGTDDYGPLDSFNGGLGHQPVASTSNEVHMNGSTIVRGHTTILVYDMQGSTLVPGASTTETWGSNADPIMLELSFNNDSAVTSIYHGMVLSDRVLTHIPLPIRTDIALG